MDITLSSFSEARKAVKDNPPPVRQLEHNGEHKYSNQSAETELRLVCNKE